MDPLYFCMIGLLVGWCDCSLYDLRGLSKSASFCLISVGSTNFLCLITGYGRNVASFNSHQSAYIFCVIYLFVKVGHYFPLLVMKQPIALFFLSLSPLEQPHCGSTNVLDAISSGGKAVLFLLMFSLYLTSEPFRIMMPPETYRLALDLVAK